MIFSKFFHFSRLVSISFLSGFSLIFLIITSVNATIVTSIKPIGFITEAIASSVVDTDILLPDGASPHAYSLKPSDLVKIKNAELIIWIGDDMETFLPSILKNIVESKQVELMQQPAISQLLRQGHEEHEHDHDHDHDHHHGEYDTHIWLSPEIAKEVAKVIHQKLVVLYPEKVQQLNQNLNQFLNKVQETEEVIAKKLINVQNSGYFVFHDAYGYFESEFGLNNLGHFTINPSIQPGVKRVYEIQKRMIDEQAVCVFREPQFNPAVVDKLVKGTNVRVGDLDPLGSHIPIAKDAYFQFLFSLTQQLLDCLENR